MPLRGWRAARAPEGKSLAFPVRFLSWGDPTRSSAHKSQRPVPREALLLSAVLYLEATMTNYGGLWRRRGVEDRRSPRRSGGPAASGARPPTSGSYPEATEPGCWGQWRRLGVGGR